MREERGRGSRLVGTLQRFLQTETSGAVLLLGAAAAAMVWANLASESYRSVWTTDLTIVTTPRALSHDLRHWINDGAMALFFFVVGLEVKRELVTGELRDRRTAALPVFAALGGMVVPAGIYLALNIGTTGHRGWAIPMATDIAFAVGVLSLVGSRAPSGIKLFLLTLAIVDDIGAIVVIALAYSEGVSFVALGTAIGALAILAFIQRVFPRLGVIHVIAGLAVWMAVSEAGVHATLAGVMVALVTPVARAGRLEDALHPWSSFVVVPAFALANAGVDLGELSFGGGATAGRIASGVALGLVVGKIAGVSLGAAGAVRLGLARMPHGARWIHLLGVAALAGIGFTVSLFVSGLAFSGASLEAAKAGVLTGSLVAGLVGAVILSRAPSAQGGTGVT